MTPRQRVLAALNGDDVDRPPVSNPTSVATVELCLLYTSDAADD